MGVVGKGMGSEDEAEEHHDKNRSVTSYMGYHIRRQLGFDMVGVSPSHVEAF